MGLQQGQSESLVRAGHEQKVGEEIQVTVVRRSLRFMRIVGTGINKEHIQAPVLEARDDMQGILTSVGSSPGSPKQTIKPFDLYFFYQSHPGSVDPLPDRPVSRLRIETWDYPVL